MQQTLCLGGGKMVETSLEEGKELVLEAKDLGIDIFDAHHRYGNCEKILSQVPEIKVMSKVSAYHPNQWTSLMNNTIKSIGKPYIYWVSDLDDELLYGKGVFIYERLSAKHFTTLGITSENPDLIIKFALDYPECRNFMVPIYPGSGITQKVVEFLQTRGSVFAIKPFDDGRALKALSVIDCLRYQTWIGADYIIFGTKNRKHLKEVVGLWNSLKN